MADELFEFEIKSFAFGGMAVGRLESGKVCFVRGAAPGERVLAKTVSDKSSHRVATLVKVLKASDRRIEPFCPLAPHPDSEGLGEARQCPGCSYQHVPYEDELSAKESQLRDFISRWLKLDADAIVKKSFPAPSRSGWRNKITLSCEGGRAGYRASDNKTLVPIVDCPLAQDGIRTLMKDVLSKEGSFEEGSRLTFREGSQGGAIFWKDEAELLGPPLTEALIQGEFQVPRGSFFQVNRQVASGLLTEFGRAVRSAHPEHLVDMYCGVGTFAITAAKFGVEHVNACEIDEASIASANANALAQGFHNCNFVAGDAAKLFKSLAAKAEPSKMMLVLDPPRGGLSSRALKEALAIKARHIIYVSCAADALTRDLKAALAFGYKLKAAKLFDMFPSTSHFETLALLELH